MGGQGEGHLEIAELEPVRAIVFAEIERGDEPGPQSRRIAVSAVRTT